MLDLEAIRARLGPEINHSSDIVQRRADVRVLIAEAERLRAVLEAADAYLVGLRQARYGMEPPGEAALTKLSCAYTVARRAALEADGG